LARLRFVVDLGLAATEPVAISNGRAGTHAIEPRRVLQALLSRLPAPEVVGQPNRYELLRTVVVGSRGGGRVGSGRVGGGRVGSGRVGGGRVGGGRVGGGRLVAVAADCHAGPRAGWGVGPDIDTGAPPSIAVQLLASGEMPVRPGVWAPEQVVPVEPFLRELQRRGMRVTVRRSNWRAPRRRGSKSARPNTSRS